MDELLQTNIFFYITAASVVIITILVGVVVYYVVTTLQHMRRFVERMENELDDAKDRLMFWPTFIKKLLKH